MTETLALMQRRFTAGRFKESGTMALIAAFIAVPALLLSEMPTHAWPYALSLVLLAGAMGYLGRVWGRMTSAALLLGTLPLSCALLAQAIGHVCTPGGCTSLCVPLCTAGGAVAGVLLARIAAYSPRPVLAWLAGASIVSCCGAIGCSCVGASGLLGMGAGLVASAGLVRLIRRCIIRQSATPPAAR